MYTLGWAPVKIFDCNLLSVSSHINLINRSPPSRRCPDQQSWRESCQHFEVSEGLTLLQDHSFLNTQKDIQIKNKLSFKENRWLLQVHSSYRLVFIKNIVSQQMRPTLSWGWGWWRWRMLCRSGSRSRCLRAAMRLWADWVWVVVWSTVQLVFKQQRLPPYPEVWTCERRVDGGAVCAGGSSIAERHMRFVWFGLQRILLSSTVSVLPCYMLVWLPGDLAGLIMGKRWLRLKITTLKGI